LSDSSTEVLLRRLTARDNRFQEHRELVFDERHEVYVVVPLDDEDALAPVTLWVRVLQDFEQVAALDVENDVLEPDAAIRLELRAFFASSQAKYCTDISGSQRVLDRHTLAPQSSVAASVPKRRPRTVSRDPTPTKVSIKNGPEIIDFRPVLGFLAALANRRLQPLGHLTAREC
jgi:hypothetical protein